LHLSHLASTSWDPVPVLWRDAGRCLNNQVSNQCFVSSFRRDAGRCLNNLVSNFFIIGELSELELHFFAAELFAT